MEVPKLSIVTHDLQDGFQETDVDEYKKTKGGKKRATPLRVEDDGAPHAPLPKVRGGFRTILADPPWRFANRTGKVAPGPSRLCRAL